MQVLANLPGDVGDVIYVLLDELPKHLVRKAERLIGQTLEHLLATLNWPLAQCSMFAVWGSRTAGGGLISGRNLDWNHDTGIDKHKLVTVFHPPGKHAHATFGFGGLIGALAGMSAAGLTTHEANLESNKDSFRGFPWLLRLRYVMEEASTLAEARRVWESTNNTVGFNHMIASAVDGEALVMETNAVTTAFFSANDTREVNAAFDGPGRVIRGAPMPEALFRTNHGFDGRIVSHYMWNTTHAYNDSDVRYHLISSRLATLGTSKQLVTPQDAVDLTSLAGQKGPDYTICVPPFSPGGSNVLSVTTDPTELIAYAAWEDGSGIGSAPENWRPAACSAYLKLDLKPWFA